MSLYMPLFQCPSNVRLYLYRDHVSYIAGACDLHILLFKWAQHFKILPLEYLSECQALRV